MLILLVIRECGHAETKHVIGMNLNASCADLENADVDLAAHLRNEVTDQPCEDKFYLNNYNQLNICELYLFI